MKPTQFIDCISLLFKDEGGYVNDPDDAGGETKFGISKRAYPNENIRALTYERARAIYKKDYWDRARCEELNQDIRYIHFDTAVNCGIRQATKILQRAGGINDDGVFGPQTLTASKNVTIKRYAEERILFYKDLVKQRPSNQKFLNGWIKRVERIEAIK